MKLETTECIEITNKNRTYTDCMEFSLLRFIQMLAHCPKQLEQFGSSDYSSPINSGPVGEFIKTHGKIFPSANYYLDKKSPGVTERADWAEFVSDRDFLHYYRNDSAELFTSVTNIIRFFNGFYQMDLGFDEDDFDTSLDSIAKYFTTDNVKVSMEIVDRDKNVRDLPIKDICRMISRPDDEFSAHTFDKRICSMHTINTTIQLEINKLTYYWTLTEVFLKDSEPIEFTNKYITGHSVIRPDDYYSY